MKGLVTVLGVVAFVVLLAIPVSAAKPQPLDLSRATGNGQTSRVIEKQNPWPLPPPSEQVVNPLTGSTWDINDHDSRGTSGYLSGTVSTTWSHIFDWNPIYRCINGTCADWSSPSNWVGVWVQAPSSALTGSVCLLGRCFALNPIAAGGMFDYKMCVQAVYVPDDPAIVDIPGSNGGRGVPSVVGLMLTNPTGRVVKDVAVGWGISSDVFDAPGCSDPAGAQTDYPFRWY